MSDRTSGFELPWSILALLTVSSGSFERDRVSWCKRGFKVDFFVAGRVRQFRQHNSRPPCSMRCRRRFFRRENLLRRLVVGRGCFDWKRRVESAALRAPCIFEVTSYCVFEVKICAALCIQNSWAWVIIMPPGKRYSMRELCPVTRMLIMAQKVKIFLTNSSWQLLFKVVFR